MNTTIEGYFENGCGRCPLGGTPECKVHRWEQQLQGLREIILRTGLREEVKWGVPCYTYDQKNVIMLGAYMDNCVISFLKGALLQDAEGILEKPGPNSRSARVIRFTDMAKLPRLESAIEAYIYEAIEVERAGLSVESGPDTMPDYPAELAEKLAGDPALQTAFENLTPGRIRGYLLHFNGAKQSATRLSRIEKCIPKIMEGKGFHDR